MSLWTDFRDTVEEVGTLGLYNPEKSREAEREQRRLINEQIQAYKEQTNLANEKLNEARNETAAEKRRINEKQIRSLRNNYRSSSTGFLGVGSNDNGQNSNKLGG